MGDKTVLNRELELIDGKQIQDMATVDPTKTLDLHTLNIDHDL